MWRNTECLEPSVTADLSRVRQGGGTGGNMQVGGVNCTSVSSLCWDLKSRVDSGYKWGGRST